MATQKLGIGYSGLTEKATVWPVLSGITDDGSDRVGRKYEIDTRWEKGRAHGARQFQTNQQATGRVFVDRELPVGSILWRGKVKDATVEPSGLYIVTSYYETNDVKGRDTRRVVTIAKYKNKLPPAT